MIKNFYIILMCAFAALGLVSCSKEAPFDSVEFGKGKLLTHALALEVNTSETLVRASSDVPDKNDFTVRIFQMTSDGESIADSYIYKDMPEVLILPVGHYRVEASYGGDYGDGKSAAFGKPYYKGVSEEFDIENNKIVDYLDPIVCSLSNVKVTILFDQSLSYAMTIGSKVLVSVGKNGTSLEFDKSTLDSGYFEYESGSSTLAASFNGSVDGDQISETKTYNNVLPGTHYRITFKLHTIDPNEPGDLNPGDPGNEVKVDAVVELEDLSGGNGQDVSNVTGDMYLEDDRYPTEDPVVPDDPGNDPGNEQPGGDTPDDPQPAAGPTITACPDIDLNKINDIYIDGDEVVDNKQCILYVHSDTGFTEFTAEIISNSLSPDELIGVGLNSHLDLVNPGALAGPLEGLGLPVNVGGLTEVKFDISTFLTLLAALGDDTHTFKITVSDASGTTVKELKLKIINI